MPFLRLYSGEHFQKQWSLTMDRLTIGRAVDNDIVLLNTSVSKYHVVIEKEGSSFVLIDNQSSNGVFINGQRIERQTLSFWDEIQIHPYKLVYMALAKLPGEEEGQEQRDILRTPKDETMMVRSDDLVRLLDQRQKERAKVVFLSHQGTSDQHILDKPHVTLGRARSSDIRCGGWFAPGVAATIQLRQDGHHDLVPARRGRVLVNGLPIREPVRLAENDRIEVQGVVFSYYIRPLR